MEIEKRKMLFFGIILGAAVIGSLTFFLWGTILNRGTLKVSSDAPFRVEKVNGEIVECSISSCQLKLKSGDNDLIFHKDGYKSMLLSPDVKLWRTTLLNVRFQIIPKIELTDRFPEEEVPIKYSLEKLNGRQALVQDDENIPIVYFNKSLKNPLIFANKKNAVLIEEKKQKKATLYKVNIQAQTRNAVDLEEFEGALQGSLSPDGSYLLFWKNPEEPPLILNTTDGEITPLESQNDPSLFSWTYDDSLIFVTQKEFKSKNISGKYDGNYIELLNEEAKQLLFAAYHPDENSYVQLADFSLDEILLDGLPEFLIAASNGQIIYFKSGDLKYKVQLRQF